MTSFQNLVQNCTQGSGLHMQNIFQISNGRFVICLHRIQNGKIVRIILHVCLISNFCALYNLDVGRIRNNIYPSLTEIISVYFVKKLCFVMFLNTHKNIGKYICQFAENYKKG